MPDRSKAQKDFIDQRTRQLMVKWCDYALRGDGTIPDLYSIPDLPEAQRAPAMTTCRDLEMHREYFDHAIAKKWLGVPKEGRRKINSAGWTTAKSFLKR